MEKIMESGEATGLNIPFNETGHAFHALGLEHFVEFQSRTLMNRSGQVTRPWADGDTREFGGSDDERDGVRCCDVEWGKSIAGD
jgi:hypothetical protein